MRKSYEQDLAVTNCPDDGLLSDAGGFYSGMEPAYGRSNHLRDSEEGRLYDGMMATLDIMPTFARLAGAKIPRGRVIDGLDQSALVTGKANKSVRSTFYYYLRNNLQAVRRDKWKLILPGEKSPYGYAPAIM